MASVDPSRLNRAYQTALSALLAERNSDGYWSGEISSSAFSTATAVCALIFIDKNSRLHRNHATIITSGLGWLAQHQNDDGGWGDTIRSPSNTSTTMQVRTAFHLTERTSSHGDCVDRANAYLSKTFGKSSSNHAKVILDRFGVDRTFSVPILATSALAGLVDWRDVKSLPFELACLPRELYRFLRLPVVSDAIPLLIAVGQLVHHFRPTRNLILRIIRSLTINKSLGVLESFQPENGGFLESVPLTGFVTLSLAATGRADHSVVRKGLEFIENSARPDGSWPITGSLCARVTALAVNALAAAGELCKLEKRDRLRQWLLGQQFTRWQPFTGTKSGGWGWTDSPGSVPNALDTAGVMSALSHLVNLVADEAPNPSPRAVLRGALQDGGADPTHVAELPRLADLTWQDRPIIQAGLEWLLDLQNLDGGWPTFCRGWRKLPFDRSGPDLTALALRALSSWKKQMDADQAYHTACGGSIHFAGFPLVPFERDLNRGMDFLGDQQRADGSWAPLWFVNEGEENCTNAVSGTALVLAAYRDLDMINCDSAQRGISWLSASQNADGSWGTTRGTSGTIEETALAMEIMLEAGPPPRPSVNKGLAWLVEQIETSGLVKPSAISLHGGNLGFFEKLYPMIFSIAALGRARNIKTDNA
jgi:squalene-hopene/tetraprenyl-beta-curcumene cyclase